MKKLLLTALMVISLGLSSQAITLTINSQLSITPESLTLTKYLTAETVKATTFYGSGAGLTGLPAGTSIGSKDAVQLTGAITFDAVGAGIKITQTGQRISFEVTATGGGSSGLTGISSLGATTLTGEVVWQGGSGATITQNGNNITIELSTTNPTVGSGTGEPTSVPSYVGQIYINNTTGGIYMAMGTAGSYNWGYIGNGNTSAFSATNPAGLRSWFKADSGVANTGNGTTATGWNDNSSYVNHCSNINGAPKYYTGVQNGLPAVYYNGGSEHYATNLVDVAQPYTVFVVFKGTSWGTGAYQTFFSEYNGVSFGKNNGNTTSYGYAGTVLSNGSLSDNTTYIQKCVLNGASSTIAINGAVDTTGNAGTSANYNYPVIGAAGGGAQYFTGYVMEILVYDGDLTSANQTIVRNYLNNKWAVY